VRVIEPTPRADAEPSRRRSPAVTIGVVGLAMLEDEAGLPADAIDGVPFEVDVAGTRYPARASIRPLYDPERRRITA
jgi:glycine cleavage system aminomethyltransferase T